MSDVKKWAAAKTGKKRGDEHVVVHKTPDGEKVSVYPSKKAAHEAGMAIRRAGGTAFAHSTKDYKQFINPSWDGKASGGGVDERERDELGRFA